MKLNKVSQAGEGEEPKMQETRLGDRGKKIINNLKKTKR